MGYSTYPWKTTKEEPKLSYEIVAMWSEN
jgi:hypothetical protein